MAQANLPTIYDNKPEAPKEKIVESVINGDEFVSRRRSLGRKIIDVLFNGDIQDVKSYVVNDVFIPAVKETIFEMVNKGLDMVLFGGSSRSASKQNNQREDQRRDLKKLSLSVSQGPFPSFQINSGLF